MTVYDHVSGRLSELDQQVVAAVPPGGNWRDLPADFPSARVAQIRRGAAAGEGSRSTYYGRLHPDQPAYTISTYFSRPGNGCYIHPEADRLITVREAARLQGFPDSFRLTGRGRSRYIQVGNAVPPLLSYQLARVTPGETTVDLFSGAGGLALGFAWCGFEVVAAVDSDASAMSTFAQNIPTDGAMLTADLSDADAMRRALREAIVRAGKRKIDVLTGGPPCQGFSTAGKWLSRDRRNDLVFAFVAAAEALRPRRIIMENVAALLWRRGRPFLDAIRTALESAGYRTAVALLHTEGFGIPQRRRRLILLGSKGGQLAWPVPTHAVVHPAYPKHQPGSTNGLPQPFGVADAISDLPLATADDPDLPSAYRAGPRTPYQRWARGDLALEALVGPTASIPEEGQLELDQVA